MTPEKLDELYALATSTNPACEWTESMGFVNPLLIVDLIDRVRELETELMHERGSHAATSWRVRELEGENKVMRELVHSANNPLTGTHTVAWQQKARAALNKEST